MTAAKEKNPVRRHFQGVVVSNAMAKTIVVRVDRLRHHPKYKKYYRVSRKFKVHDERGQYKPGDVVRFEECRPISKDKRWRALPKIA
ncbi:MAG: 30S ribosomal protein S17 [Patescibacteria group bacterium]